MQTMVEMGKKIYTAIFKRIWRSSKEEYAKLYRLNRRYLPDPIRQLYTGDENEVAPVADPNATTDSMKLQAAITVKQAAATTRGYDLDEVERRFLRAARVENIEQVFPGTEGQPPAEDPKVTLEKIKQEGANQRQQNELEVQMLQFAAELQEERILNGAKIIELQAKAMEAGANAENETAYAQAAIVNTEIARLKAVNEARNKQIESLLKAAKINSDHQIGMKAAVKSKEAA